MALEVSMTKHSLYSCWFHIIWGTKERYPYFENEEKALQCKQILEDICRENKIYVESIYVNSDHVHMLVSLPANLSVEGLMHKLKGTSSHTINKSSIFDAKFLWSRGYALFSVSESNLSKVANYIKNQKQHHAKKSYQEEMDRFQHLLNTK